MTDFFVATNGNNGAVGSEAAPWLTIQYGVAQLAAGDTLNIRGGIYNEAVTVTNDNGTLAQPLTIKGYNGEAAIIDGQSGVGSVNAGLPTGTQINHNSPLRTEKNWQGWWVKDLARIYGALMNIRRGNIIIEDLEIRHSMGRCLHIFPDNAHVNGGGPIPIENVTVRNCLMHDARIAVLYIFSDALIGQVTKNILVEDCMFYDIAMDAPYPRSNDPATGGRNHPACLGMGHVQDVIIRRCTLHDGWGEGIFINSLWTVLDNGIYYRAERVTVEHCTIYNTMNGAFVCQSSKDVVIDSNLIYMTGDWGAVQSVGLVVENNEAQYKLEKPGDSDGVIVSNNLILGCVNNFRFGLEGRDLKNTTVVNNTLVNTVSTYQTQSNIRIAGQTVADHPGIGTFGGTTIFKNNIIIQDQEFTPPIVGGNVLPTHAVTGNNFWTTAPAISGWAGANDRIGDPLLVNHRAELVPGAVDPNNYKLKNGSPAINAGDSSLGVDFDYFNNARIVGENDIGMHKYGTSTAVITAAFSGDVLLGDAPLGVQFTDASSATNGIRERLWSFGDGSPSSIHEHPFHTFSSPGTYTITLQVTGAAEVQDTETKVGYIVVTDPGGDTGPGTDTTWKAGVFMNQTSGGNQVINHGLGVIPKGIVFFPSGADVLGQNRNDAHIGAGVYAGGNQFASTERSLVGWSPSNTHTYKTDAGCLVIIGSNVEYHASFVSWDQNNLTINWGSPSPSSRQIPYLIFGGDNVTAEAVIYDNTYGANWDQINIPTAVNLGWRPNILLGLMISPYANQVHTTSPEPTFGISVDGGVENVISQHNVSAANPTDVNSISQSNLMAFTNGDTIDTLYSATGFSITPRSSNLRGPLHILAIKITGATIWNGKITAPIAAGNTDYTAPLFEPDVLLAFASAMRGSGTPAVTGDDAGSIAAYILDANGNEYSTAIGSRDNVDPAQERSHAAADLTVIGVLGAVTHQGVGSFIPTGWRWNMSIVDATARTEWIALAVSSATNPSAKFSLDTVAGRYDETVFNVTDLSTDNGLGTITYNYSWGDGSPDDTIAEPSHIYTASGPYTITQTVTAGGNQSQFTIDVTILEPLPVAAFLIKDGILIVDNTAPNVPITFESTSVAGGNETITAWEWILYVGADITQNIITTSILASFDHTFTEDIVGINVYLKVTQSGSQTSEAELTEENALSVTSEPVAFFTALQVSESVVTDGVIVGPVNLTIRLADESYVSGAPIVSREFRILNSAGQIVASVTGVTFFDWTFLAAGDYGVQIEIVDSLGHSSVMKTDLVATATGVMKQVIGPPTPKAIKGTSQGVQQMNEQGEWVHDHPVETSSTGEPRAIAAADEHGGMALNYLAVGTNSPTDQERADNVRAIFDGRIMLRGNESGIGSDDITNHVAMFHDLVPYKSYATDLGTALRKFGELHAAALIVDTLVRREVVADIGGRVIIGRTAALLKVSSLTGYATLTTDYKPGEFEDYLLLEADGSFEIMRIASDPAESSDKWFCDVSRGVLGVITDWPEGTAILNTGGSSTLGLINAHAFIDIYAHNSIKSIAGTKIDGDGPTMLANIRYGDQPLDFDAGWAIGNLAGLYHYTDGTPVYGAAFGQYSEGTYIAIDNIDGMTFHIGENKDRVLAIDPIHGVVIVSDATGSSLEKRRLSFTDIDKLEHAYIAMSVAGDGNPDSEFHIWLKEQANKTSRLYITSSSDPEYESKARLGVNSGNTSRAWVEVVQTPGQPAQIVLHTNVDNSAAPGYVTVPWMPTHDDIPAGTFWMDNGVLKRTPGCEDPGVPC